MEFPSNEISFLIVGDLHEEKEATSKFVNFIKESNKIYDYILCCGDIVTIKGGKQSDEQTALQYDPLIKDLLEKLSEIKPKKNLYYIPGNHDSKTVTENLSEITSKAVNLQKKYVKLAENLYMIGLGGSVPILFGEKESEETEPFSDLDTKRIRNPGFPYNHENDPNNYEKSDEDFGKDVQDLIDQVKKENINANIILFTHVGPRNAWTNYSLLRNKNAYLGSKKFEEIFFKEKNAFLNIHGHTHKSKGLVRLGLICEENNSNSYCKGNSNKYIVNPGDLQFGNYASLIIKLNKQGNWDVSNSFFGKVE